MAGSFRMYKHMWIERKLSDHEIKLLCAWLVHDTSNEQSTIQWPLVKPVPEQRFRLGVPPQQPIVKLCRRNHAQAFFDRGDLQLGSFGYYSAFDHSEIGDTEEGVVALVAKTPFGVMAGKYGSGFDQRILCSFVGVPDAVTMRKFGYDSGFVVNDPRGFAEAVATSIGARSFTFGQCLYRKYKAVLGFPGNKVDRHRLSHRTGEIVKAAKYFIKPDRYAHQREFRFLWEQMGDVSDAKVFDCSSARQFCAPLPARSR